jgi:hypothetical protein
LALIAANNRVDGLTALAIYVEGEGVLMRKYGRIESAFNRVKTVAIRAVTAKRNKVQILKNRKVQKPCATNGNSE